MSYLGKQPLHPEGVGFVDAKVGVGFDMCRRLRFATTGSVHSRLDNPPRPFRLHRLIPQPIAPAKTGGKVNLRGFVDQKLEEQIEFVRWWKETVTPNRDRRAESENAERRFQRVDAESITGITQQQVSKWAKKLQKPEQYRERNLTAAT